MRRISGNSGFGLQTFLALALSATLCRAGVTVVQNVSPGATSWPGSPFTNTMSNPAGSATVQESFNSANTSLGQTFRVATTNYTLQKINLYAGGGSGGTITVNLYDLGDQSAPNPATYSGSINLIGSGSGVAVTYASQSAGVLEFDFTGSDQVILQSGHMYAFELAGTQGTTPVYWYRAGSDTYSGGTAYRNQSYINGVSTRDFALAVYGLATNKGVDSAQCTVNWTNLCQKIDGFGGGVVFLDSGLDPVTDANADTLFATNSASQLGLSLLRVRISPDTNWSTALSDAKKAVARGGRVLATPWTPPASMKSGGSTIGGSLLAAQYANYASYLNKFATSMVTNGTPLAAISVQNEPDITVTYESCSWTAAQFLSFFRTNAVAITNAPVMMPESFQFDFSQSDSTLNDATAVTNVDVIGGHLYGTGTVQPYANALSRGKPVWMTEYLVNDQTWSAALATAQQLHGCLAVGNMAGYIWWKCLGNTNGLVNASGVPQKRGFVLAQYSRFVRPGYYRVGITNVTGNILISAFKDTNSGSFAIVAINNNLTTVTQAVSLSNFTAGSVTPWITSTNLSLASQSPVTVASGTFSYPLPAQSVVTFVGQASTGPVSTTNTIQSSANPSTYGNAVTFTATVTPSPTNGETITFKDSSATLGTGTLNNGQATYTTTAGQLTVGAHAITAVYAGDGAYGASTSSALSQMVDPRTLTVSGLTVNSKVYDGATNATLNTNGCTLNTVVGGDVVTVVTNGSTATFASANAGTGISVTVSGLTLGGAQATNYTLPQPVGLTGTITVAGSAVALSASANPVAHLTAVTFTATVTPAGLSGTMTFLTNGVTFDSQPLSGGMVTSVGTGVLPRGTNTITARYSGNANYLPATNTLSEVVTNNPPAAKAAVYYRLAGLPLTIGVSGLATNWSDLDGDELALAGVSSPSMNGAVVTYDSGNIYYQGTNDVADRFGYAVSDGQGGTTNGIVTVLMAAQTISDVTVNGDGSVTLNLEGIPGGVYWVEGATNLMPPVDWVPLGTNTAGTNGLWQFTDSRATNHLQQFYRLYKPD